MGTYADRPLRKCNVYFPPVCTTTHVHYNCPCHIHNMVVRRMYILPICVVLHVSTTFAHVTYLHLYTTVALYTYIAAVAFYVCFLKSPVPSEGQWDMWHSHPIIYINAVSIVLLHIFMVVLSNYCVDLKMTPVPSVGLWDMGHLWICLCV